MIASGGIESTERVIVQEVRVCERNRENAGCGENEQRDGRRKERRLKEVKTKRN